MVEIFSKNQIFSTFMNWNFLQPLDFGGLYLLFKNILYPILKRFWWCYDPKRSENMFLGRFRRKINFFCRKSKIYLFGFRILKNQFSGNCSPLTHLFLLKIAPIDRSKWDGYFELLKSKLFQNRGKVRPFKVEKFNLLYKCGSYFRKMQKKLDICRVKILYIDSETIFELPASRSFD